jgi:hypothetical protein
MVADVAVHDQRQAAVRAGEFRTPLSSGRAGASLSQAWCQSC